MGRTKGSLNKATLEKMIEDAQAKKSLNTVVVPEVVNLPIPSESCEKETESKPKSTPLVLTSYIPVPPPVETKMAEVIVITNNPPSTPKTNWVDGDMLYRWCDGVRKDYKENKTNAVALQLLEEIMSYIKRMEKTRND